MSTKTTFKRVALVTVAALGFGVLTTVVPAQAAVATTLGAAVGPNGATSLTVVGGTTTTVGALIRLDVTGDESSTPGLSSGDTIVGTVSVVPTTILAKTLAANGGSMATTATAVGAGFSDFVMLESIGQTSGTGTTAAAATTVNTDWTAMVPTISSTTNLDTATVGASTGADGTVTSSNTGFTNKDGTRKISTAYFIKHYYVTVMPRTGADVIDRGAYTFSFQLKNSAGIVLGTKTVKIDFVSAASLTDATVTLAPVGTFIKSAALESYDSATANAYASITLRNRDGGLIRTNLGDDVAPSAKIQWSVTGALGYVDTATLTVNDSGTYGADFGTDEDGLGTGTLQKGDGIYGLTGTLPSSATSATAGSVVNYRWWVGYGNATLLTPALVIYAAAGGGTADPAATDVLATAAGMSTTDQAVASNISSTARNFTVPTTTKSATLKFTIQTASSATAAAGVIITATPTWTGPNGSAEITPATSTTGTAYTTDALGNFTISVTNSAPIDTAKVTIVLTSAAAFGAGKNTVSITWAAPAVTTIAVADPVAGISVLSGSTNVTTVIVKDQFGNPMAGERVSVSATQTPAVVSTTVITPITTGASGTATYSYTPAAATTSAVLSFNTTPTAVTAATATYTYVATLPVVATLTAYHGYDWGTAATLTPSTGIYTTASGSTRLAIVDARNISKATTVAADTDDTNDQIALLFTGLTSAGVSATGASVTVTASAGGHILSASLLPVQSRTFAIGASGTAVINVLATGTGAITFTATSGTVTATATMWVAGRVEAAARTVSITGAATGAANASGVPVTVTVTDRYGNPVSNVAVNVVASGVGSFMGGSITNSYTTDASGTYTFLANTTLSDGGVAKYTATTGSTAVG